MNITRFISFALSGLALAATLSAQGSTLTTGFNANNKAAGNMFDLVAVNAAGVTVKSFDVNIDAGVWDLEVYRLTIPGPYLPSVANAGDWTLICSVTGVAGIGPNFATPLPIAVEEYIPPGATQAFYVTVTNGSAMNYTNGIATGALAASNADLEFYEGAGMCYPFGCNFNPRVWNGNIHYDVGNTVGTPQYPCIVTPKLVGVAEAVAFADPLSDLGGGFSDGDFLRWNYDDVFGSFPAAPALTVLNYGIGAPAPVGVTAFIPGFDQVWAASTPVGYADILSAGVGGSDFLVQVPGGIFALGDGLRIQGLVLDLAASSLADFLRPTNAINFVKVPSCLFFEDFEATALGAGNYPVGWSSGGGVLEWTADVAGTASSGTGPNSGSLGSAVYMYCETSFPAAPGDTYIMNTDTYSLAGASAVGFDLSRIGATIGTLEVRMDDGSGTYPTLLWTYTGPEPSGIEWTTESIPLPAGAPANASFQFRYFRGQGFTGDLAVDNFCIN